MNALKIIIIFFSFFNLSAYGKTYFDFDQTKLKNGTSVVVLSSDWGADTEIASLFIKNGAVLKFDRKTSFPVLAFKLVNSRLQRLAKEYGFIVKGTFDWDYSGFIFYFPKGFLKNNGAVLWDTIFSNSDIDSIELENIKHDTIRELKQDLNRKLSRMSLLSLMSPNSSIYSLGVYGNEDDLKSITEKEFGDFLKCYLNPLGAFFVVSGVDKSSVQSLSKELEKKKPCFRDQRFSNEVVGGLTVPVRKINYVKANGKNSIIRVGFPSVSCTVKGSFIYDVVQQLVNDDKELSSIGRSLYVSNNCSAGGGTIEFLVGGLKKENIDQTLELLFTRLSVLSKNIDDKALLSAKQKIKSKYAGMLSKRDKLVFLTAKFGLLYGDASLLLEYVDKIGDVTSSDVKKVFAELTEKNSYTVLIRLGN